MTAAGGWHYNSAMKRTARTIGQAIDLGIGLEAECRHCGARRELNLRSIAEEHGPTASLGWLQRRLGCRQCDKEPREAMLNPIQLGDRQGAIQGAFGGAYDHAYETPARKPLTALEGPLRRDPRGRWK